MQYPGPPTGVTKAVVCAILFMGLCNNRKE